MEVEHVCSLSFWSLLGAVWMHCHDCCVFPSTKQLFRCSLPKYFLCLCICITIGSSPKGRVPYKGDFVAMSKIQGLDMSFNGGEVFSSPGDSDMKLICESKKCRRWEVVSINLYQRWIKAMANSLWHSQSEAALSPHLSNGIAKRRYDRNHVRRLLRRSSWL